MNRYKVFELSVDSSGRFYLNYAGTHGDQGGLVYRWGGFSLEANEAPKEIASYIEGIINKEAVGWVEKSKAKKAKK